MPPSIAAAPIRRATTKSAATRTPSTSSRSSSTRLQARSKQLNCEGGFFLFGGNKAPECGPLSAQIQQMRANLDRINADLSRLQNESGPEHDAQRRAILVALSQNDCGQQYKTAVASTPQPRGGLFESLFGPKSIFTPRPAMKARRRPVRR